ncbi:MAG TPA: DUF3237 family protein [Candidatus Bathyarchaeia archaeon]
MPKKATKTTHSHKAILKHLFDIELIFKWKMPPLTSRKARAGEYIGSGEGKIKGPKISGTVSWDIFEEREETLCRSSLLGEIETDDTAKICFDSRGFFIQPDKSNVNRWITSASVHFDTADQRYKWLNTLLAVWEGEFDMEKGRHHYQAYAPES